jgi:hypothetical protein
MKANFIDSEVKYIIEKFNNIGFNCKYQSFNTLMVTFGYENYHLTIHKRNDIYYFIVYRPGWGQFINLFVNSYSCQEIFETTNKELF